MPTEPLQSDSIIGPGARGLRFAGLALTCWALASCAPRVEKDAHVPEDTDVPEVSDTDTGELVTFEVTYEVPAVRLWALGRVYLESYDLTLKGNASSNGYLTFVSLPDRWRLFLESPDGACAVSEERELEGGDEFEWEVDEYTGSFAGTATPACE